MPSLLHPERWRELAPEFEARKLIIAALGALADAPDHHPVAKARATLETALRMLHPVTQDPKATEEYEQRLAGTYEPEQGGTGERWWQSSQQKRGPDPRDAELSELRERLAKLEAAKPT